MIRMASLLSRAALWGSEPSACILANALKSPARLHSLISAASFLRNAMGFPPSPSALI